MAKSNEQEVLQWKLLEYLSKSDDKHFSYNPDQKFFALAGAWRRGEVPTRTQRAAISLIKKGFVSNGGNGSDYHITLLGAQEAKKEKPVWIPPDPPKLNQDCLDVLMYELGGDTWQTPQRLGGTNGSHHSNSLTKLVQHGLAECKDSKRYKESLVGAEITPEPRLLRRGKGTRMFRITEKGKEYRAKLLGRI